MTNLTGPMDPHATLRALAETAPGRIVAAADLSELADLEAELVGKQSAISTLRRGLGTLEPDERRALGAEINGVAATIRSAVAAKRTELAAAAEAQQLAADRVDVTLPGRVPRRGSHHLVTTTMAEIVDIFTSIGYTVASGPEIENDFYNFTALNIPKTHPARLESDTLYVDFEPYGEERDDGDVEILLRTHTSPMQARYMEMHEPPVYIVVPGRVFRRDDLDPTHSPVFHQVEGLAVDDGITFGDLKGTLAYMAKQFFGPKQTVRFLPDYFPFTEPSAQMHVSCFACDFSGCRVCGHTGWIELAGCGMVHPAVFEAVGYDTAALTGFAFGVGADRFAMVRHGISDLRHFFESDVRVLGQFK